MTSLCKTKAKPPPLNVNVNNVTPKRSTNVYRCGFTASADGKIVSGTKYRVRWRVGFFDDETGNNEFGRGDNTMIEHEVLFVWSVASGKRLVLVDGEQKHFSVHRGQLNFEVTWNMRGHFMSIIGHAIQPLKQDNSLRQFDLLINGDSFFLLPEGQEIVNNADRFTEEKGVEMFNDVVRSLSFSNDNKKVTSPVGGASNCSNDTKSTCSSSTSPPPSHNYLSPSTVATRNKKISQNCPCFV